MIIALEKMRFFASVGYYEEEQILGNEILIDVMLNIEDKEIADTENLDETISYESVYEIVKKVLDQRISLLETVAEKIQQSVFENFLKVKEITVTVRKLHPPLPGSVYCARVERHWIRL